jgi:hypothetical protein
VSSEHLHLAKTETILRLCFGMFPVRFEAYETIRPPLQYNSELLVIGLYHLQYFSVSSEQEAHRGSSNLKILYSYLHIKLKFTSSD